MILRKLEIDSHKWEELGYPEYLQVYMEHGGCSIWSMCSPINANRGHYITLVGRLEDKELLTSAKQITDPKTNKLIEEEFTQEEKDQIEKDLENWRNK